MERLEREWTEYPVFHLDLNAQKYESPQNLTEILNASLTGWEKEYGAEPSETSLSLRFRGVVRRAAEKTGRRVVVLVDEYDKPLLQAIGDGALQDDYRNTLKAFYGVLKSCDQHIRFALLTGVTKFSKVSVFSDLNNLQDISMLKAYEGICGVTEEELRTVFPESVGRLAEANGLEVEEAYGELKKWYDGYHFAAGGADVYNPFSLLNTFKTGEFGNYWFETGTPTFLVELLKKSRYDLRNLTEEQTTADVLGSVDTMDENPVPVLYQIHELPASPLRKRGQVGKHLPDQPVHARCGGR